MKKQLLLTILCIANLTFAQNTLTFESLTVPASGYFNGATAYSGSGNSEILTYQEGISNLYVNYTAVYDANGDFSYDYWNGFAYSNQTDMTTADWNNYSAYTVNGGGGANNSATYGFVYTYSGDTMTFDNPVILQNIFITNTVWAYKYMTGTDGTGTGTYTTDDYLKLTITAVTDNAGTLGDSSDDTLGASVDFYLADFTNGNSYIIDDWTNVDLSSLGTAVGLKFQIEALDTYTPYYFTMDDLTYEVVTAVNENNLANSVSIFPNPSNGKIAIKNIENANLTIFDLNGRQILSKNNCSFDETFNLSNLDSGIYFVNIQKENNTILKKLILN